MNVQWPDWPSKQTPKRWAWAPIWHVAVRANMALRAERRRYASLGQECRRLEAILAAERVMRHEAEAERDRALVVALEADPWGEWDRLLEEGWPA